MVHAMIPVRIPLIYGLTNTREPHICKVLYVAICFMLGGELYYGLCCQPRLL